jgi:hypothetical protein
MGPGCGFDSIPAKRSQVKRILRSSPAAMSRRQWRHGAASVLSSACAGKPKRGAFMVARTSSATSVGMATTRIGIISLLTPDLEFRAARHALYGAIVKLVPLRFYPGSSLKLRACIFHANVARESKPRKKPSWGHRLTRGRWLTNPRVPPPLYSASPKPLQGGRPNHEHRYPIRCAQ